MKHYDFEKEVFLDICERDGVKVTRATEGEAKFLLDGKPFDPVELIENLFKEENGESAMKYLSDDYQKLVVLDVNTGKEIAVITNDEIATAEDNIVVKLTPVYD